MLPNGQAPNSNLAARIQAGLAVRAERVQAAGREWEEAEKPAKITGQQLKVLGAEPQPVGQLHNTTSGVNPVAARQLPGRTVGDWVPRVEKVDIESLKGKTAIPSFIFTWESVDIFAADYYRRYWLWRGTGSPVELIPPNTLMTSPFTIVEYERQGDFSYAVNERGTLNHGDSISITTTDIATGGTRDFTIDWQGDYMDWTVTESAIPCESHVTVQYKGPTGNYLAVTDPFFAADSRTTLLNWNVIEQGNVSPGDIVINQEGSSLTRKWISRDRWDPVPLLTRANLASGGETVATVVGFGLYRHTTNFPGQTKTTRVKFRVHPKIGTTGSPSSLSGQSIGLSRSRHIAALFNNDSISLYNGSDSTVYGRGDIVPSSSRNPRDSFWRLPPYSVPTRPILLDARVIWDGTSPIKAYGQKTGFPSFNPTATPPPLTNPGRLPVQNADFLSMLNGSVSVELWTYDVDTNSYNLKDKKRTVKIPQIPWESMVISPDQLYIQSFTINFV